MVFASKTMKMRLFSIVIEMLTYIEKGGRREDFLVDYRPESRPLTTGLKIIDQREEGDDTGRCL